MDNEQYGIGELTHGTVMMGATLHTQVATLGVLLHRVCGLLAKSTSDPVVVQQADQISAIALSVVSLSREATAGVRS